MDNIEWMSSIHSKTKCLFFEWLRVQVVLSDRPQQNSKMVHWIWFDFFDGSQFSSSEFLAQSILQQ